MPCLFSNANNLLQVAIVGGIQSTISREIFFLFVLFFLISQNVSLAFVKQLWLFEFSWHFHEPADKTDSAIGKWRERRREEGRGEEKREKRREVREGEGKTLASLLGPPLFFRVFPRVFRLGLWIFAFHISHTHPRRSCVYVDAGVDCAADSKPVQTNQMENIRLSVAFFGWFFLSVGKPSRTAVQSTGPTAGTVIARS